MKKLSDTEEYLLILKYKNKLPFRDTTPYHWIQVRDNEIKVLALLGTNSQEIAVQNYISKLCLLIIVKKNERERN